MRAIMINLKIVPAREIKISNRFEIAITKNAIMNEKIAKK